MSSKATATDLELAIVLPLGVLAQQLARIEAQLRAVNMRALDLASEDDHRQCAAQVRARLEHISDALDSIRDLVSDLSPRKPAPALDD